MPLGVRGGGGLLTSSLSPSLSFRIPCTVRGRQVCAGDWEGHLEGEGQIYKKKDLRGHEDVSPRLWSAGV